MNHRSNGKKDVHLLFVLPYLPKYDRAAGCLRMSYFLEKLAAHYAVDVIVHRDERAIPEYSDEEIEKYRRHLEAGGAQLAGYGLLGLIDVMSRRHYSVICFEFFDVANKYMALCRRLQPRARLIIDSVDVRYMREAAAANLGLCDPKAVEETRRQELSAYRASYGVIAITDQDQKALLAEGGMPPLFLIPIVLEVYPRPAIERAHEVVFVGGFKHPPNGDGVCWFVREIWGAVRDAVPDAQFTIIGSNPPPEVLELGNVEGVTVVGFVP